MDGEWEAPLIGEFGLVCLKLLQSKPDVSFFVSVSFHEMAAFALGVLQPSNTISFGFSCVEF